MNGNMNLGKMISALEKGGGGSTNIGHVYSTDEKVVGKWFDKTLYEKTYIANISDNSNWVDIATITELNIDEICIEQAVWKSSDGYWYEGNKVDGSYYHLYRCSKDSLQFSTSGMNINAIAVTINYTKTE